jgi:imidazolonepropionase-like amidohydrolase
LRVARKVGSLDPGKQADFLVLNVQDYRDMPLLFGLNHVHLTVKAGAPIYREAGGTWPEA